MIYLVMLLQKKILSILPEDENGLINTFHGVSWEGFRDKIFPKMMSYENPIDMPDWFVPEDEIYLRLLNSNIASLRVMEKNGARCVRQDEEHFFMRIHK